MSRLSHRGEREAPALRRLAGLTNLAQVDYAALREEMRHPRTIRAKRDVIREGDPIGPPLLVLDGWGARVRQLADGRRQIITLILPGDLIGYCQHPRPVAWSSVMAITELTICPAPDSPALREAYAISNELDNAYLGAAVSRLGRLNAQERLADLFVELLERLDPAGLAVDGSYALPLTQELLADALGLTSVHVNRTIQTLRKSGTVSLTGGRLHIHDPEALGQSLSRLPVRVSDGPTRA